MRAKDIAGVMWDGEEWGWMVDVVCWWKEESWEKTFRCGQQRSRATVSVLIRDWEMHVSSPQEVEYNSFINTQTSHILLWSGTTRRNWYFEPPKWLVGENSIFSVPEMVAVETLNSAGPLGRPSFVSTSSIESLPAFSNYPEIIYWHRKVDRNKRSGQAAHSPLPNSATQRRAKIRMSLSPWDWSGPESGSVLPNTRYY